MGVRCSAGACDARQTRTDGRTDEHTRSRDMGCDYFDPTDCGDGGGGRAASVAVGGRFGLARSSGTKNVNQLVVAVAAMWCRGRKNTIPPESGEIRFFSTRDELGRVCVFTSPRTLATVVVWSGGGGSYATFADPRPQRCLPLPLNFCHVRLIIIVVKIIIYNNKMSIIIIGNTLVLFPIALLLLLLILSSSSLLYCNL